MNWDTDKFGPMPEAMREYERVATLERERNEDNLSLMDLLDRLDAAIEALVDHLSAANDHIADLGKKVTAAQDECRRMTREMAVMMSAHLEEKARTEQAEEQAEAFKALSESIKNEQRLESDDPVQILREAGIECPELKLWLDYEFIDGQPGEGWSDGPFETMGREQAILALVKLAAKYKWQPGEGWSDGPFETMGREQAILALAKLAAKYKWQRDECWNIELDGVKSVEDMVADLTARWERRTR